MGLFGTKEDVIRNSVRHFRTKKEAEFFKKPGERVFYDPRIKRYYTKFVENPFW